MHAAAAHDEAERQRAGGRRHQPPARRLADHGEVAGVAATQRGERPEAAVLLADDALQDDPAAGTQAGVAQRLDRQQLAGQTRLHVAGPAAEHPAVAHLARPGRRGPALLTRRDDVDVPVEDHGRAVSGAPRADEAPRLVARRLGAGELRVGGGARQVDAPQVGVEPDAAHPRLDPVLRLALGRGAGHRRDPQEVLQLAHEVVCPDGRQRLRHLRLSRGGALGRDRGGAVEDAHTVMIGRPCSRPEVRAVKMARRDPPGGSQRTRGLRAGTPTRRRTRATGSRPTALRRTPRAPAARPPRPPGAAGGSPRARAGR